MDLIFHEKQEGSLCAQHCLNALLQGPYFTPVDLATLAQRMDDEERSAMAESGVDTEEYRTFIQQPSGNMDDSGFFSVQVISAALAVWNLELVPLTSSEPIAVAAKGNPEDQNAFICNYREHWFTIRKLGRQWFNLNSILSGPELVSTTYLSILLAQLEREGYSIFVVRGRLPQCAADEALLLNPAAPRPKSGPSELERALQMSAADDDELAAALRASLENDVADDPSLNEAIRLSLTSQTSPPPQAIRVDTVDSDDELLAEAIRLSLQSDVKAETTHAVVQPRVRYIPIQIEGRPSPEGSDQPDVEEVRRRRLAYLEKPKT